MPGQKKNLKSLTQEVKLNKDTIYDDFYSRTLLWFTEIATYSRL